MKGAGYRQSANTYPKVSSRRRGMFPERIESDGSACKVSGEEYLVEAAFYRGED
jgi:hypothetical protein